MSDKHPSPNKSLFWTDKRPLAPDVETRISCAISEIGMAGVQVVSSLMFIGFLLLIRAGESEDFSVARSMSGPLLMMLATVLMLVSVTGAHEWFPRSVFQSGIPSYQTRLSRILLVIAMAALAGLMVNVVLGVLNHAERSDLYLAELAGLYATCALASYGSSILVRARWILDLRAEQGYKLPLDTDGEDAKGARTAWYERPTK
ncbi:MAG: hypothetical protein RL145_2015 [Pseudomonadota bacterium]|jgi:hypothetical protein